jgi:hypothetical protein
MALQPVMAKTPAKPSSTTLGDVLYAKSKPPVAEQDWAALVQAIAGGDQLALHALYERAHRVVFTLMVRSTCSTMCGDAPQATTRPTARCSAGS